LFVGCGNNMTAVVNASSGKVITTLGTDAAVAETGEMEIDKSIVIVPVLDGLHADYRRAA
jgi:hypothetical protein